MLLPNDQTSRKSLKSRPLSRPLFLENQITLCLRQSLADQPAVGAGVIIILIENQTRRGRQIEEPVAVLFARALVGHFQKHGEIGR